MQRIKEIIARLMSAEQRTKYDALQAEYDSLKTEKSVLEEEARKRQARANRATEDFQEPALPRRSHPGSGAAAGGTSAIPRHSPAGGPEPWAPEAYTYPATVAQGTGMDFRLPPRVSRRRIGSLTLLRNLV